tara:strand:+ start:9468 stop:10547 length:1080 start_codon:yes stop_codon:yes gene_type:complete
MNKKIKAIFIGCGRVTEHYLKMFQEFKLDQYYEIVACVDVNKDSADRMAKLFNCLSCNDLQKFLKSNDIDVGFVNVASFLHFDISKTLIEHKVTPIVEKPPVLKLEHLNELKKLENEYSIKCAFIFQNRLNPAIQYAKKALNENSIGKIITASVVLRWCRYNDYYSDAWHGRWNLDGGVAAQQGIHHIDALQFLNGKFLEVTSFASTIVNDLEAEDTIVAIGKFSNESLCTFELTTGCRPEDIEASISFTGDKGFLKIGGEALNFVTEHWQDVDGKITPVNGLENYSEEVPSGYGLSHSRQLKIIADEYLNNMKTLTFELDSVSHTMQLIHALYRSNEDQATVKIDDNLSSKKLGVNNG